MSYNSIKSIVNIAKQPTPNKIQSAQLKMIKVQQLKDINTGFPEDGFWIKINIKVFQ